MNYPNLRHIRLFCACLRAGSLTQAADIVGVTQPAASQAISRLEDLFGARLLERGPGHAMATPEGRVVQARSQRALELIHAGCKELQIDSGSRSLSTDTRLTISHLRALQAFSQAGGFPGAARILEQSGAAVQRTARNAEAILGIGLFEADGRITRLTSAGHAVARWAGLSLKELGNAMEQVQELRGNFDGLISIGALPMARTTIVPDAIALLASTYPLARFEILEGSYEQLLSDLEMGHIDFLIGALRSHVAPVLVQEPLFDFRLAVVAGAGHPLSDKADVSINDLAAYPWVVARKGTPNRSTFDALAATFPEGRPKQGTVETGSLTALRGILMQSDRLALLSRHQLRHELKAGFLTLLNYEVPAMPLSIGITTRCNWHPTALQAEYLSAIRRVVAGEATANAAEGARLSALRAAE
ncbi:LysR substrate-binding domain-containing protein [Neorhizobium sp. Rsf11]|uniref:LysR substrate-binding domain-containing protein n=2 Tax=Neorhizobium TaxID=1525371 RepID=A0ABV0LY55_9HYPH|nr:LysR substrate-binding domain-containing protein [Neorhizobium petrolearium]MCC2612543.1 LysR family transcriptional regulator [Neorhizobium petrolearium]WGI67668.1 LysR substrate-binding domain-containing protein [Neorhizobium petrolearium]